MEIEVDLEKETEVDEYKETNEMLNTNPTLSVSQKNLEVKSGLLGRFSG